MKHRTFLVFILPALIAMLLFIALPIGSVVTQSLYTKHEQVVTEVENCGPFGCQTEQRVDHEATAELRREQPLGRFAGSDNYLNRGHLAIEPVARAWHSTDGLGEFLGRVMNLPFYKALIFTLVYCFTVTPLAMLLGFALALGMNRLPGRLKGPAIFVSILPMIITPLIGSLMLFWMFNARGILGATIQSIAGDPTLSMSTSPILTWLVLLTYGIWTNGPFSFVVFYAALQSVPGETLESALLDGASRWERIRYVVIPHVAPVATFIVLVQLMDNFRVFEPIVGFSTEATATSLSWLVYNDLVGQDAQQFGSAAATSVLTILGVFVLLIPVVIRSWRDFSARTAR